ncbi:glycosyltransferase involved in cell wall biosynthesis [Oxalobacteraceae bacterium GrIS 1.11]
MEKNIAGAPDHSRPATPGLTEKKWPLCAMVGPGLEGQGGVASVVQVYAEAGLFADGQVSLLASYSPGGALAKLRTAAAALGRYAGLLLRGKAAVLHIHVSSRASFWRKALFIWLAVLTRRRVVFHLHGGGFRQFIEDLSPTRKKLAIDTIRRCDQLLCLASPTLAWLEQLAPAVPVRWWPNPVPAQLFEPAPPAEQREPVLLYLGALLPAKGVLQLLEAFAILRAHDPQARLVLGGSGAEQAVLQAYAAANDLREHVTFLGWIDTDTKTAWLRRARVLALASHLEAQPMVLLEAMASGATVVSTNVGGIPDLITHERDGLLAPPHDATAFAQQLLRAWQDPALRQRLTLAARQRVLARHHAVQVCAALRELYQGLAPHPQGE